MEANVYKVNLNFYNLVFMDNKNIRISKEPQRDRLRVNRLKYTP